MRCRRSRRCRRGVASRKPNQAADPTIAAATASSANNMSEWMAKTSACWIARLIELPSCWNHSSCCSPWLTESS
jgi:hypothetical protein